ncbi:MAG: glycosyltransferase [Rivularia sp. (in: cyanobacteria)]
MTTHSPSVQTQFYKATLDQPLVSIIVEGYNENHNTRAGILTDTIEALRKQEFPLDRVELVLTGDSTQVRGWQDKFLTWTEFYDIKTVVVEGHLWRARNLGAEAASGEILAFTDCDVCPQTTWLNAIVTGIQQGADVVVGPSLFHKNQRSDVPWLLAASAISWGIVVGSPEKGKPRVVNCLGHNLAARSDVFKQYPYPDVQRSFTAKLFFNNLVKAGKKIDFQSGQKVHHDFTWQWWLLTQRFRAGWEAYLIRQMDESCNYNRILALMTPIAPLVSKVWHICLDFPQWFRYARAINLSLWKQLGFLPVVFVMSCIARGTEMVGMYAALIAPKQTEKWAKF